MVSKIPFVLPKVAKIACCYRAFGDISNNYPGTILPLSFHRGFAGFVIGDYCRMSGAPLDRRDCWWHAGYRSRALPDDCNNHCLGTPLLLAPFPHVDSAPCYGSVPPDSITRCGDNVIEAP